MRSGIKITERDQNILYDCYEKSILSYAQVHKAHFPSNALPTVSNRLGRLVRAGYLVKTRTNLSLYFPAKKEVGAVFQVTRKGIQLLRQLFPEESFCAEVAGFNPATLAHDICLSDVMAALQGRFPGKKIVNAKNVSAQSMKGNRQPDALVLDADGSVRIAVELELTIKSALRYRHIVLQYQTSKQYPAVLYVTRGKAMWAPLRYHITGCKDVPGLPLISTGKFYFVSLEDLTKNPVTNSLTNGSSELVVS